MWTPIFFIINSLSMSSLPLLNLQLFHLLFVDRVADNVQNQTDGGLHCLIPIQIS